MTLKDFVYLDVERLYSLYSQVFEGVVEQIVQSFENSMASASESKGIPFSGNKAEAYVAELSRRTENKFLYDHMYNTLEQKLQSHLLDASTLSVNEIRAKLLPAPFIKVRGAAEVDDYERVREFIKKFNAIGEAVAHAVMSNGEINEAMNALNAQVSKIKDRNERARTASQLKAKSSPKAVAKELGLHQDEQLLKHLDMFSEMFYPDGFDITIAAGVEGNIAFRAPIGKQWLRFSPSMLRTLFGGYSESSWTLVGQVTHVPGDEMPQPNETDESVLGAEQKPSMKDPFKQMFRASRTLERMFLESNTEVVVTVCPLAIYRETAAPIESDKSV